MASLAAFTDPLGTAKAAHLLRRATFGPTMEQINTFASLTPQEAVASLFPADPDALVNPTAPIDTATGVAWVTDDPTDNGKPIKATDLNSEQDSLMEFFKAWHVDVMLQSDATVTERITWFYHTHIPARWTVINSSEAIYYQNCIYRHYAHRSFKELFKKICVDNAMLKYLDGDTNHRNGINENFAREMFELYSIGRGPQLEEGNYTNYTEHDIIEASKVLSGWIADDDFATPDVDHGWPTGILRANGNQASGHDYETKTFSSIYDEQSITPSEFEGQFATLDAAKQELDEMIEMIFDKDATAQFITRKLYRSFVYHFISDEVETDIIVPLAAELKSNGYNISEVLKTLLASQHFYDADDNPVNTSDDNIGAIIKSPLDLALGIIRFFGVSLPDRITEPVAFYDDVRNGLIDRFEEQGLNFYEPFEVAGYPAYHQMPGYGRNWVMPKELAFRYQIGERFMKKVGNEEDHTFQLDVLDYVNNSGHISDPGDADEVVTFFTTYLLAVEINTERYEYFRDTVFLDALTPGDWASEWSQYDGTPSTEVVVRGRLETLVSKIIQSPEFQLL